MLPYVDDRPRRAAAKVVVDRGVNIPEAWWSARIPSSTPSGSAAPKSGICLITQPMIDQLTWRADDRGSLGRLRGYPLIKTGGLADVAGALPAALAPHGVDDAHAAARLSRR